MKVRYIKHEILYEGLNKIRAEEIERKLIIDLKLTDRDYGYNTILPYRHKINLNLNSIPVYSYIQSKDTNGHVTIKKFIG